ncbi:S-adenosyl-L-methionine-dependent methyltransferase [Mucor mucedo]|uniref:S-adenosyl-L-methionine-dependent methyltransferase n=1 Tax=Mucor mucedo TaxID=29922 RepID=UPI00221F0E4E|nr:S-adenosyl-L-methionine-dependent methyltransferase [Mucor mucedo]KAI7868679.1 S-adenosyl-L-methionine-dependent methyltransferase [Mucor mucedo]
MTAENITHTTCEIAFELKDGRLLANNQDVAYILPSDATEVARLQLNHNLWNLYKSEMHEKLTQGARVLDIGCGPGWWTLDMARLYPNSEFIGIDMADVFYTQDKPANASFKIMNAGTGMDFEDASFDFVFQRFLVMGFPTEQYLLSIKEMKRILKPEGSIELLELVNHYNNAGPAFKNISDWSKHMDSFIADKISTYLLDAGYANIQDITYNVPIGSWGGEPGEMFLAVQKMALPAVKVMVTELTEVTSEEYDKNLELAFKEADERQISTRFRLIYATK